MKIHYVYIEKERFIVRDADKALFDFQNFRIIKYNNKGFKIIQFILEKNKLTPSKFQPLLERLEIKNSELERFLQKNIEAKVLTASWQ